MCPRTNTTALSRKKEKLKGISQRRRQTRSNSELWGIKLRVKEKRDMQGMRERANGCWRVLAYLRRSTRSYMELKHQWILCQKWMMDDRLASSTVQNNTKTSWPFQMQVKTDREKERIIFLLCLIIEMEYNLFPKMSLFELGLYTSKVEFIHLLHLWNWWEENGIAFSKCLEELNRKWFAPRHLCVDRGLITASNALVTTTELRFCRFPDLIFGVNMCLGIYPFLSVLFFWVCFISAILHFLPIFCVSYLCVCVCVSVCVCVLSVFQITIIIKLMEIGSRYLMDSSSIWHALKTHIPSLSATFPTKNVIFCPLW